MRALGCLPLGLAAVPGRDFSLTPREVGPCGRGVGLAPGNSQHAAGVSVEAPGHWHDTLSLCSGSQGVEVPQDVALWGADETVRCQSLCLRSPVWGPRPPGHMVGECSAKEGHLTPAGGSPA